MKQQVNLYQPALRKKKVPLSAITMLESCGLALGILGATYAYNLHSLEALQLESDHRIKTLNQLRETVAALRKGQRAADPVRLIDAEIQRTQNEIARRQRLVGLLSQGSLGNTHGFSDQFTALARQHVDGTWLTSISIGSGGESVALQGITRAPELVPIYLDRLLKEPAFANLSFNEMELTRADATSGQLRFRVTTGRAKP